MTNERVEETPVAAMPLYYKSLVPLVASAHRNIVLDRGVYYRFATDSNCIPITIEEFSAALPYYPIVFGTGNAPIPFILTGAPGGGNQFVEPSGAWRANTYVPAYVRRYPFFLAKLEPTRSDLTLCFDPSAPSISQQAEGGNLYDGDNPSSVTKSLLQFCEQYEVAAQKTMAAMAELVRLGLLIDGEANIQSGSEQPETFRGFQIVDEKKLHELDGADVSALVRSGGMAMVYAHLFSLRRIAQFAKS